MQHEIDTNKMEKKEIDTNKMEKKEIDTNKMEREIQIKWREREYDDER